MNFEYPMALWLMPIIPPIVGMFLWLAWRREKDMMKRFGETPLFGKFSEFMPTGRFVVTAVMVTAGLVFLITAIARPVREQGWTEFPHGKIDVVAVIDVSRSMAVPDYDKALKGSEYPDGRRLDIAKHTIMHDIIPSLNYNKLGVVTYAGKANPLAFLTDDMLAMRWVLKDGITMGSAPGEGSNMVEAFDLALRMFELDSAADHKKIIVLFSDGGNDADIASLHQIMNELEKRDIELMIVGCGKPIPSPIPIKLLSKGDQNRFGDMENYEHEGQVVTSKLDENSLLIMRNRGGARYVRMVNPGDFQIGRLISGVEVTKKKGKEELFPYFLMTAFALMLTAILVPRSSKSRISKKTAVGKKK